MYEIPRMESSPLKFYQKALLKVSEYKMMLKWYKLLLQNPQRRAWWPFQKTTNIHSYQIEGVLTDLIPKGLKIFFVVYKL